MAQHVFLSYSSADKAMTDTVCGTLERQGIRCWMAPRDILPGMDWAEAIMAGIAESHLAVLIVTAKANASTQVKREIERLVNRNVAVVPFRAEDVSLEGALEYHLSTAHWLDACGPRREQALSELPGKCAAMIGRASPAAAVASPASASAPPSAARPSPGPRGQGGADQCAECSSELPTAVVHSDQLDALLSAQLRFCSEACLRRHAEASTCAACAGALGERAHRIPQLDEAFGRPALFCSEECAQRTAGERLCAECRGVLPSQYLACPQCATKTGFCREECANAHVSRHGAA